MHDTTMMMENAMAYSCLDSCNFFLYYRVKAKLPSSSLWIIFTVLIIRSKRQGEIKQDLLVFFSFRFTSIMFYFYLFQLLAEIDDETKIKLGYTLNDLVIDCDFDGQLCKERYDFNILLY